MWNLNRTMRSLAPLAIAGALAACEEGSEQPLGLTEPTYAALDSTFSSNTSRTFVQVERLGNPLFAEALLLKREHSTHDSFGPERDPGHFTDDAAFFLTAYAGRSTAYATTVGGALLGTATVDPGDKVRVYPARAAGVVATNRTGLRDAGTVGFLTQVLAPNNSGYGGRKLEGDDVVDKYLGVAFGTALGEPATAPALATDNVDANDKEANSTFPYFPAAN